VPFFICQRDKGGNAMGFLKFLLSIGLIIVGGILVVGSFLSGIQTGIATSVYGGHVNSVSFWVTGIIGFVVFLGGIYLLRKR
jgi:hypothetical protein